LNDEQNFETLTPTDSNIVCFRWNDGTAEAKDLNHINTRLRQSVLEEGRFYIVQTSIQDVNWLRISLMNPMTTIEHLKELVSYLKQKVNILLNSNVGYS